MEPTTARELVYLVFEKRFRHTKINDTTKLANMGIDDGITKKEICDLINERKWHRVNLKERALERCTTIKDITSVVEEAEEAANKD
jgi:hypothetical protein